MANTKKSTKSKEEEILEKLGKLNNRKEQLQCYSDEISAINNEMDTLIKDNIESLTGWETDRISKGKKDIIAFGTNAILRSKTTRRKIIPSKFIEKYPLEANVLIEEGKITIPIGVVEEELGKNKVNEICEATTTFNYKYESRKVPTSISVNEMKKEPAIENKKTHKASKKMKVTAR